MRLPPYDVRSFICPRNLYRDTKAPEVHRVAVGGVALVFVVEEPAEFQYGDRDGFLGSG